MILKFLIIGVCLFFSFRFSNRIIKRIPVRKKLRETIIYIFPIAELVLWIFFLIWAVHALFEGKFFYPALIISLIILLLILIGWFVIKDFIAGMIIKTGAEMKVNDIIKIADLSGKVLNLGYLSFVIENEEGERITIPYSKISGQKIIKPNPSNILKKFKISLTLPKTDSLPVIKEKIRRIVLNAPWTSITKPPVFNMIADNGHNLKFEIAFYALSETHAAYVDEYVKKAFSVTM